MLTQIRAMPKIELHRHLEGSLRLETLLSIAAEHNIPIPSFSLEGLRPHVQMMADEPRSADRFLSKFQVLRLFFRSEAIIRRVTQETIADAATDNVKYMELRFTPKALNNLLNSTFEHIVACVCDAAEEAAQQYDMGVKLILSINRHESYEIGEQVIDVAAQFSHRGVVGIDLAGREADFSALPFLPLFERARSLGLGLTIHAGEWLGADNVREAVEVLEADRIGHGIRAVEDDSVVELLAERGTVLEVCPTSNVHSGVVAGLSVHPLVELFRRGVKTTINTDDPLISNITLGSEIEDLLAETTLTLEDVKQQTLTAARAAFLPAEQKAALVSQFQQWLYQTT